MHESWKEFLDSEFQKPYFKELSQFLHSAYETSRVFPAKVQVFRAFTTDLNSSLNPLTPLLYPPTMASSATAIS